MLYQICACISILEIAAKVRLEHPTKLGHRAAPSLFLLRPFSAAMTVALEMVEVKCLERVHKG